MPFPQYHAVCCHTLSVLPFWTPKVPRPLQEPQEATPRRRPVISIVGRPVDVMKVPRSSPLESIDGIWNCRGVVDAMVDLVDVLAGRNWLAVLWCYEGAWLRPFLPSQPEKKILGDSILRNLISLRPGLSHN